MEERIPTTTALKNRGLNIPDVTCGICGAAEETAAHILIQCNFAKTTWEAVADWLHIPRLNTEGDIKDLLVELKELQRGKNKKRAIHAVVIQTMWILWKNRNGKIFSNKQGDVQRIMMEIKEASYQGVKTRSKFRLVSRQEWWDFNLSM
ncbi:uncharacterized protein LOC110907678 [Helianthus annuus]|uniref:uncharacterized protein LOC110907678 n=1 Tax=Helianthus annuus TaxID=4232 RepID=UPI000B8EEC1C|nr:uncharacterized protein LOC110907678 [Helianthus annuus]